MKDSKDYTILSKLKRSNMRIDILKLLIEPKTPVELAKLLKKHRGGVSRALLDMANDGLVECLNPKDPNYRFYKTTEKGKKILEDIKK